MTRKIDYAHAAVLSAIEKVKPAIWSLAPHRELDPRVPPTANDGILTAIRSLNMALTALEAAEESIMTAKNAEDK